MLNSDLQEFLADKVHVVNGKPAMKVPVPPVDLLAEALAHPGMKQALAHPALLEVIEHAGVPAGMLAVAKNSGLAAAIQHPQLLEAITHPTMLAMLTEPQSSVRWAIETPEMLKNPKFQQLLAHDINTAVSAAGLEGAVATSGILNALEHPELKALLPQGGKNIVAIDQVRTGIHPEVIAANQELLTPPTSIAGAAEKPAIPPTAQAERMWRGSQQDRQARREERMREQRPAPTDAFRDTRFAEERWVPEGNAAVMSAEQIAAGAAKFDQFREALFARGLATESTGTRHITLTDEQRARIWRRLEQEIGPDGIRALESAGKPPSPPPPPPSGNGFGGFGSASSYEPAAKAEGTFARFMREEKWAGKKGLAFAAGAAVLGGAMYMASQWRDKSHVENLAEPGAGRGV